MKITIFSKPYWPSLGGVEVTSRVMARLLSAKGHEILLLTDTSLGGQSELAEGYSVHRRSGFLGLMRFVGRSDVLVIKGGLSVPAALTAYCTRTPYVVWHEMAGSGDHSSASLSGKARRKLAPVLINRAALHVGVSQACLDSKPLPHATRTAVVWNPVAPELEKAAGSIAGTVSAAPIDVLFVGRFIEGKGILVLAEALASLDKSGAKLTAWFVGHGPDEQQLRRHVANLSNVRVEFPGALATNQLSTVYSRARCLVLPSTSHPEGMPLVVGEAFTFGVPVIGSDQPAIIETVGGAGLIAKQGDATELAAALQSFLENESLRLDYCARARQRAKLFASEAFADLAERLIQAAQAGAVRDCG